MREWEWALEFEFLVFRRMRRICRQGRVSLGVSCVVVGNRLSRAGFRFRYGRSDRMTRPLWIASQCDADRCSLAASLVDSTDSFVSVFPYRMRCAVRLQIGVLRAIRGNSPRLHQVSDCRSAIRGINSANTMNPTIAPSTTTITGSRMLTSASTRTATSSS